MTILIKLLVSSMLMVVLVSSLLVDLLMVAEVSSLLIDLLLVSLCNKVVCSVSYNSKEYVLYSSPSISLFLKRIAYQPTQLKPVLSGMEKLAFLFFFIFYFLCFPFRILSFLVLQV
ncbi:hypothetical protein ACOSP7_016161 [Xanthoceras sorbifolium]